MPESNVVQAPSHTIYQRLVMKSVNWSKWIMDRTVLPYLSWAAKESGLLATVPFAIDKPYIESSGPVNPLLLMAAFNDKQRDIAENPEACQAKLNSILETISYCDVIRDAGLRMFGMLVAKGAPPEIALAQYFANGIELGMYVQRRLQSANAEESQPAKEN